MVAFDTHAIRLNFTITSRQFWLIDNSGIDFALVQTRAKGLQRQNSVRILTDPRHVERGIHWAAGFRAAAIKFAADDGAR